MYTISYYSFSRSLLIPSFIFYFTILLFPKYDSLQFFYLPSLSHFFPSFFFTSFPSSLFLFSSYSFSLFLLILFFLSFSSHLIPFLIIFSYHSFSRCLLILFLFSLSSHIIPSLVLFSSYSFSNYLLILFLLSLSSHLILSLFLFSSYSFSNYLLILFLLSFSSHIIPFLVLFSSYYFSLSLLILLFLVLFSSYLVSADDASILFLFLFLSHHLYNCTILNYLNYFLLHLFPFYLFRGYLEESINISTAHTALALQHICWSRSAAETGRILSENSRLFPCCFMSLPFYFYFSNIPYFFHFIPVFLGERISECVMCVTGVDLAYRTYFRILSELLLSDAVEVRERTRVVERKRA